MAGLKLLPALPTKWPTGQINGLIARGGVSIDIQWDTTAGTLQASLTSRAAQTITLKLPFAPSEVNCDGGEINPSDLGDTYRQITLPAGHAVTIDLQK